MPSFLARFPFQKQKRQNKMLHQQRTRMYKRMYKASVQLNLKTNWKYIRNRRLPCARQYGATMVYLMLFVLNTHRHNHMVQKKIHFQKSFHRTKGGCVQMLFAIDTCRRFWGKFIKE